MSAPAVNPYVRASTTTASAAPSRDRVSGFLLGENCSRPADRQAASMGFTVAILTWIVIIACLYFVWDFTQQSVPAPADTPPANSQQYNQGGNLNNW